MRRPRDTPDQHDARAERTYRNRRHRPAPRVTVRLVAPATPHTPTPGRRRHDRGLTTQRISEFLRGLVTRRRIALERARDHADESFRHAGGDGWRRPCQLRFGNLDHVSLQVRPLARDQFEQQYAEAVEIRPFVDLASEELFRSHVRRGTDDHTGARQVGVRGARVRHRGGQEPCDSEVEDLHEAICPEDHVCRFQVPVHDPPGMCMHERVGDLAHDFEHRVERHLAAADESGKRIARHIFHDDIRVVAIDDHIMDGSNVRMIELAQHLRFEQQPCEGIWSVPMADRNPFQRHLPEQLRVPSQIDLGHSTGAERAEDRVPPDVFVLRERASRPGVSIRPRPVTRAIGRRTSQQRLDFMPHPGVSAARLVDDAIAFGTALGRSRGEDGLGSPANVPASACWARELRIHPHRRSQVRIARLVCQSSTNTGF